MSVRCVGTHLRSVSSWAAHVAARVLNRGLDGLAAFAFPGRCALCRIHLANPLAGPLCEICVEGLPCIRPPYCPRCGLPYEAGVAPGVCGPCRERRGRYFRLARSAGPYRGALKDSLVLLKFGGRHRLASVLGKLAFERSVRSGELGCPVAVVPVPLHRRRRRQRGYNQAELLAEAVARCAGVAFERRVLAKIKDCPPQSDLTAKGRWRNVAGAYRSRLPSSLEGRHLLLVDDVMTTGATAEACARALIEGGAGRVDVLTVARA